MPINAINTKSIKRQCHGTSCTLSGPGKTTWMTCPAGGVDPDNPFKSSKQRKFLMANKPRVAKKFVNDTSKGPIKDPVLSIKSMKSAVRKAKGV